MVQAHEFVDIIMWCKFCSAFVMKVLFFWRLSQIVLTLHKAMIKTRLEWHRFFYTVQDSSTVAIQSVDEILKHCNLHGVTAKTCSTNKFFFGGMLLNIYPNPDSKYHANLQGWGAECMIIYRPGIDCCSSFQKLLSHFIHTIQCCQVEWSVGGIIFIINNWHVSLQ